MAKQTGKPAEYDVSALSALDKAVSVMQRTGGTRHIATGMNEAELAELATIHDTATDYTLGPLVQDFWGKRAKRLADLKATDDMQEAVESAPNGDSQPLSPIQTVGVDASEEK